MNAQQYLNQYYYLSRSIDNRLEQIERLRSLAEKTTATLSGDPKAVSSKSGARFENIVIRIEAEERRLLAEVADMENKRVKVQSVINLVPCDMAREVLTQRYLLFKKVKDIAGALAYEERQMYRYLDEGESYVERYIIPNMSLNVS